MAYVADFTTKSNAAKALTLVFAAADFPEHVIDDYLVIGITNEAEVAVTHSATAGWTQIGTTVGQATATAGMYSSMWYKKCASAAETCTITLSVTNASHAHAFLIKDADTTTFLDGTPNSVFTAVAASQFSNASITTTQPDSLLLFYCGIDTGGTITVPTQCHTAPDGNSHFIESSDNGASTNATGTRVMAGGCAAWYIQRTAGATPAAAWNSGLAGVFSKFTVGIRNKVGGLIPAYVDNTTAPGVKLMDGHGTITTTNRNNELFKATPLSVTSFITHLGTLTGTYKACTTVADVHLNPYSSGVTQTAGASATALTGFEVQFTTPVDMTTGWVIGTMMMSGPKLANFNHGSIKKGGGFLAIGQTANYRIFQVMAKDNLVNTEGRAVVSVQVGQTQTQSGASVTPPTMTGINRLWFFERGNDATLALYINDFHLINNIVAAGGDANVPVDSEGLYSIGQFCRVKMIQRQGASGLLPMVPIQIGGGDAINFQIDAGAMQFPRQYSLAKREIHYHGADNAIGISYAGKLGDVIKHTNSVITSESPYYWEINAAATSAATWDFSGLVLVKATVTLRPVLTFTGMSFSTCASVTTTGSTVTACNFGDSPILASSPANAALITDCKITKTIGTGHGITITGAAATITLTGLVFTGYAATNGVTGNEAIFVNIATGTVTINISGGGSTPSIRTAGATVTVVAGATITFTGLPAGTDIVILTAGTTTVLHQVDANAGSSYAWGYQGTPAVDVGFIKPGYVPLYVRNLPLPATDSSLPVSLAADRNYS